MSIQSQSDQADQAFKLSFIDDLMSTYKTESKPMLLAALYILLKEDNTQWTGIWKLARTSLDLLNLNDDELIEGARTISQSLSGFKYHEFNLMTRTTDGKYELSEEFKARRELLLSLYDEFERPSYSPLYKAPRWKNNKSLMGVKFTSNLSVDAADITSTNLSHTDELNTLQSVAYTINPDISMLDGLPEKCRDSLYDFTALQDETNLNFHFIHNFDRRGRLYSQQIKGLSPQSEKSTRALLQYAEPKPLGKGGLTVLKLSLASKLMKKHDGAKSNLERLGYWEKTGKQLAILAEQAGTDWTKISKCIGNLSAYAIAMDILRAERSGNPETYESSLIIHQDATSSGFQIAAALMGDNELAELTNITASSNDEKPKDLYLKLKEQLSEQLLDTDWLPEIDRDFCKKPLMIKGYGAGLDRILKKLTAYLKDNKSSFSKRTDEIKQPLNSALKNTVGSLLDFTKVMQSAINGKPRIIRWETSDGFIALHDPRNKEPRMTRLGYRTDKFPKGNICYATPLETGKSDDIDTAKFKSGISPNFIHSIDAAIARAVIRKAKKADINITTIHDSFGTHATDAVQLSHILRAAFIETMEFSWINSFARSNDIPLFDLPKKGDHSISEALKATYMFSFD